MSDFGMPSARDSGLSAVTANVSGGLPSHAAPYTTVFPSGAKRAVRIVPRRNVRRWYTGCDEGVVLRARHAIPARAPNSSNAIAPPTRAGFRDRREAGSASGTWPVETDDTS